MKYYLHRAVAVKPKGTKKFKMSEYIIQEFIPLNPPEYDLINSYCSQ